MDLYYPVGMVAVCCMDLYYPVGNGMVAESPSKYSSNTTAARCERRTSSNLSTLVSTSRFLPSDGRKQITTLGVGFLGSFLGRNLAVWVGLVSGVGSWVGFEVGL